MAAYTYKDVYLPEGIIEEWEEINEVECDYDPNYNGDLWSVTAMYIDKLIGRIEELENAKD